MSQAAEVSSSARPVVLIHVRFSLILDSAGGAWKGQRLSSDMTQHIARILDPDRIKTRRDIFFGYSIPLLVKAMEQHSDMDIRILVHASNLLPEEIKNEIAQLQSIDTCFHVRFYAVDDYYDMRGEIDAVLSQHYGHLKESIVVPAMRLDDDDLLSHNYFHILKKYANPNFAGYTIHSPRGYEALYNNGEFVAYAMMDAPKTGIGLAHIAIWCPVKKGFTSEFILPPGPHRNTDMKAPVILDGSRNVIFRTKHSFNDARATRAGYSFTQLDELESRFFRDKIDPNDQDLHENFPTLKRIPISDS